MLTTAPHLQVRRPSPTTAEFTVTTCPTPTFSNRLLFSIVFLIRMVLAVSGLLLLYSTWPLSSPFYHPDATTGLATATTPTVMATTFIHGPNNNNNNNNQTTVQENLRGPTTPAGPPPPEYLLSQYPTAVAGAALPPPPPPLPPRPTILLTPAWLPYALAHFHASKPGHSLAHLAAALPPSMVFPLCLALLYLTTLRIHTTESLLVLRGLGIQTSSNGGSYLASWRAGTRFIPTEKIRDVLINEAFRGFAVRYYLVVVVDGEDDVVVVFPRLLPGRAIVERVWRGVRGCLWEPQDGGLKRWEEKDSNG